MNSFQRRFRALCAITLKGCWVPPNKPMSNGYVRLSARGLGLPEAYDLAHRIAWRLFRGEIPAGLCVLHECDNRPCANPDHLFLGTRGTNNSDRKAKARNADRRGSRNTNAKLTEETAAAILASPLSGSQAARAFGVSAGTVSMIRSGKTWAHLNRASP